MRALERVGGYLEEEGGGWLPMTMMLPPFHCKKVICKVFSQTFCERCLGPFSALDKPFLSFL